MEFFDLAEQSKKLPERPGVYIMKDALGNVIYVGKAINLRNRVRQYFQSSSNHTRKVAAMVQHIKSFEFIITDSELEALILECNLIKKHKPKFNILLKDDKTYPYIKVTLNEEYPRVLMTRRVLQDGARYFGPYTNVHAVHETLDMLKKLFPLKTCNKVLPRDIGKERPCLNYHIGKCLAPCQGNVNKQSYRDMMNDICLFLSGRQEDIFKRIETQMLEAAQNMDYEKAAVLRDRLSSLRHITEKQKVLSATLQDQDVIAFARDNEDACIQVFFIRGGKLIGKEHFIFEGLSDSENMELMTSFIKQFYGASEYIPPEIILQEDVDEINIIQRWLSDRKNSKVHLRVPRKGDKKQLVSMVAENALLALNQFKQNIKQEKIIAEEGLKSLRDMLSLPEIPERIEAYDISNTGNTEIVGSMVVFEDGKLNKKEYRRFKIKSFSTQDDYAAMQEILFRRLREYKNKKHKFSILPDVIFVDGGKGHAACAKKVIKDFNLDIPVLGMVKDEKHKTKALCNEEMEINIKDNTYVLRLVSVIQEEAHRFAIEYNRTLRSKRYKSSQLDEIDGIGEKRKKALIKHFGSISNLKKAEVEEIEKVQGISKNIAKKIYDYFHGS